jgi:hypothetical protein
MSYTGGYCCYICIEWLLLMHGYVMEQLALNEGGEYVRTLLCTYVFKLSRTYILLRSIQARDSRSKHYIDLFAQLDDSSVATNLQSNLAIRTKLAQSCSSNLRIRLEISLVSKEG